MYVRDLHLETVRVPGEIFVKAVRPAPSDRAISPSWSPAIIRLGIDGWRSLA